MPRFRRSRLAAALLIALPGAMAAQQRAVAGVVRDSADGQPVGGVRVALASWLGDYSSPAGEFSIPAPPGRYTPRISCPRAGEPTLILELPPITVTDSTIPLAVSLAGGRRCLPALEAVSHGEFPGILRGGSPRLLELCDGPGHRVATELSAEIARDLATRFSRAAAKRSDVLIVTVRGRLEGPGFFGNDGSAEYLLTVETVRAARLGREASACGRR